MDFEEYVIQLNTANDFGFCSFLWLTLTGDEY